MLMVFRERGDCYVVFGDIFSWAEESFRHETCHKSCFLSDVTL